MNTPANNEADIQEIQLSIEHAREIVAFGEAVQRLIRSKDFIEVIDKGYMTTEVRRLTLLMGDPNITQAQRDQIVVSLRSAGELHQYLRVKIAEGEAMVKAIDDAQEQLLEIENGTGEGGDE